MSTMTTNNDYRYYNDFNKNFDLTLDDLALGVEVLPLTCQDTRKYISWLKLESALSNITQDLSNYQSESLSVTPKTVKLYTLQTSIKTDLKELAQIVDKMLTNPFIVPLAKEYLAIFNDIQQSIQHDIDRQMPGGLLTAQDAGGFLNIINIFYYMISSVLEQLPLATRDLNEEILTSESSLTQYLDAVTNNLDTSSLQTVLVDNLTNMQQGATDLLELIESGTTLEKLLTAINSAPADVLLDLQNVVDPSAHMRQLLVKLKILDKNIEDDFMQGNILDDLLTNCYSEVMVVLGDQ